MGTRNREHLKPLHLSQLGSSLWYSVILIRDKKTTGKSTHTLDKATDHMDHLGKEALKTQLQPSNYNSNGVLCYVKPGMTNTCKHTEEPSAAKQCQAQQYLNSTQ